jgi:prolipoprotein diacylglyceryl transferase
MAIAVPAYIPSPSINSFSLGPLVIHFYALMYLVGIAAAIVITRRRWSAAGGDPDLVGEIALWSVPAGIIGGRIYFDITTPMDIPHVWYGVFAVWDGGLGVWGGIFLATVVGCWRLRRNKVNVAVFMDAVAPALLVAQGIGRIGNYFNKELFGRPTNLPWGLEIPYQYRVAGGIPDKYLNAATFQPTFLYELIFDFAWAAALVWLGHHRKIKPPGLFALYVAGYSAYRIFEESLRVDSSVYILGLRLNMYIATGLAIIGAIWFWISQRRPAPIDAAAPDSAAAAAALDPATGDPATPDPVNTDPVNTGPVNTGPVNTGPSTPDSATADPSPSGSETADPAAPDPTGDSVSASATASSAPATAASAASSSGPSASAASSADSPSPEPESQQSHNSQQATS